MRPLRIVGLAVAALIATPLAGASAASAASASAAHKITPAWFTADDEGTGPTLAAAEHNALLTLAGDFGPCRAPYTYYDYGQQPNGTWYAWVSASCSNHN